MKVKLGHLAMAWAHVALGLMIAVEATFVILGMRFLMPACKRILSYADIDVRGFYAFIPGAKDFLGMLHVAAYNTAWCVITFAVAWGLFEWRVRGESKRWLRLSAMASLALLLFAAVAMFTTLMVIPMARAAERLNARYPEPIVAARMASLDRLVSQLEQALAEKDLPAADELAHEAMGAAQDLAKTGAAAATLLTLTDQTRIEEIRAELESMESSMRDAWFAARRRNSEQIQPSMQKFRQAHAQLKKDTAQSAR